MRGAWLLAVAIGASGCGEYLFVKGGLSEAMPVAPVDLRGATGLRFYALEGVLGSHVLPGEFARVEYRALVQSPEAMDTLHTILAQLGGVDPSALSDADTRLAYWLNLYNTGVIAGVVAELGKDPGFSTVSADGFGFFAMPMVALGERVITLDELEHGIIRGDLARFEGLDPDLADAFGRWHGELWDGAPVDARVHVGLNCAALSCPNLPNRAFQGDDVHARLDQLATAFVDNVDKGAGPGGISEIFTWFADDFDGSHGSVEAFVDRYRTGGASDVDFDRAIPYDWTLNAAEGGGAR